MKTSKPKSNAPRSAAPAQSPALPALPGAECGACGQPAHPGSYCPAASAPQGPEPDAGADAPCYCGAPECEAHRNATEAQPEADSDAPHPFTSDAQGRCWCGNRAGDSCHEEEDEPEAQAEAQPAPTPPTDAIADASQYQGVKLHRIEDNHHVYASNLLSALDRDNRLSDGDRADAKRQLREALGRVSRAIREGRPEFASILARHLTTLALALRPSLRLGMALDAEGHHPHDAATHPGVL